MTPVDVDERDAFETQINNMQGDLDDACDERDALIASTAHLESEVQRLTELNDSRAPAVDALEKMHNELGEEYRRALQAIDDLNVQCKFWRQAAEHAVNGWNALEDKVEAAKEAIDAIEGNLDAARELLGGSDEWAPPVPVPPMQCAISVAKEREVNGWPLRIVEEETPIDDVKFTVPKTWSCGHSCLAHPNARNYCEGAAEREGPVCSLGWAK